MALIPKEFMASQRKNWNCTQIWNYYFKRAQKVAQQRKKGEGPNIGPPGWQCDRVSGLFWNAGKYKFFFVIGYSPFKKKLKVKESGLR